MLRGRYRGRPRLTEDAILVAKGQLLNICVTNLYRLYLFVILLACMFYHFPARWKVMYDEVYKDIKLVEGLTTME